MANPQSARSLQMQKVADPVMGSKAPSSTLAEFSSPPLSNEIKGISVRARVSSSGALQSDELATWAGQDIEAALNWIYEDADESALETAYPIIMHEFGRKMPREAAQIVPELPSGFLRDSLVTSISGQWALTDPEAAFAWASALEDASLRGNAQSSVLLAISERSYQDALGYVSRVAGEDERGDLRAKVFAHEIQSQRSKTKSSHRLLEFVESSIEEIPAGVPKRLARLEAAQLLVQTHPEVAFTLAERSDASGSRDVLLLSAFQNLSERDRDHANYLIKDSKLNEVVKAQLRAVNVPVPVEMVVPSRPKN